MMVLPLNRSVIYALVDPRDGMVRYVGSALNPESRLKEHLRLKGYKDSLKNKWVKELLDSGLKPLFVFIDTVPKEEADSKELEWIQHFASVGKIFNVLKK